MNTSQSSHSRVEQVNFDMQNECKHHDAKLLNQLKDCDRNMLINGISYIIDQLKNGGKISLLRRYNIFKNKYQLIQYIMDEHIDGKLLKQKWPRRSKFAPKIRQLLHLHTGNISKELLLLYDELMTFDFNKFAKQNAGSCQCYLP
eukprot:149578_1